MGLLGQGNFSKVFRARHRFDGREYAVKRSQREVQPMSQAFSQFIQVGSCCSSAGLIRLARAAIPCNAAMKHARSCCPHTAWY